MIIAIEGPDGVGKTTIAKELAKRLGFLYVEKPLHYAFNDKKTYQEIKDKLNVIHDRQLSAWFYGFNYLYCEKEFKDKNIVCDRYVFSNYAWIYDETNEHIFKTLVDTVKEPFLTVVLTIEKKVAVDRLKKRDTNNKDIIKIESSFDKYVVSLHKLLRLSGFKYHEIDRTNQSVEDTISEIIELYDKSK